MVGAVDLEYGLPSLPGCVVPEQSLGQSGPWVLLIRELVDRRNVLHKGRLKEGHCFALAALAPGANSGTARGAVHLSLVGEGHRGLVAIDHGGSAILRGAVPIHVGHLVAKDSLR